MNPGDLRNKRSASLMSCIEPWTPPGAVLFLPFAYDRHCNLLILIVQLWGTNLENLPIAGRDTQFLKQVPHAVP